MASVPRSISADSASILVLQRRSFGRLQKATATMTCLNKQTANGASNRLMHKKDILIIDYGVGNLESVRTALDALRVSYRVSSLPEDIASADAYILPGVGAFAEAMKNVESRGLIEPLRREGLQNGKPLLGI